MSGPQRNLALTVEYDGSRFHGSQIQPDGVVTVQSVLEQAISSLLGEDYVFRAACRTDTGVHARGQVISVTTHNPIPVNKMHYVLNDRVGPYIRIHEIREMGAEWRPRYDAVLRHYRYVMCADPGPGGPMAYSYHAFVPPTVDWAVLERSAQKLVGYHDYIAFTTVPSEEKKTRRSIEAIRLTRDGDRYHLDLFARSFLRGMVRNITGWLLAVSTGRHPESRIDELLASGVKDRSMKPAPPGGLYLMRVYYPGDELPVALLPPQEEGKTGRQRRMGEEGRMGEKAE